MPNYAAELSNTLIVGTSGSGKTTFAFNYLRKAQGVACRFIFDDRGQASDRLKLRPVQTARELEASLATRWSAFYPWRMFPGDTEGAAFRFWCKWVYDKSRQGRGRKIVFIDEVWRHCTRNHIPAELATISQEGRVEEVELVTATQRPHRLNDSIKGMATELVCFRLQDRLALDAVAELGADADAVSRLPLGSFIAYNINSGAQIRGRVF